MELSVELVVAGYYTLMLCFVFLTLLGLMLIFLWICLVIPPLYHDVAFGEDVFMLSFFFVKI